MERSTVNGPASDTELIAQLRHDLRTPVNQILGYSEMLQEDAEAGGHHAYVSDLQRIQAAARQLLHLVNTRLKPECLSGTTPQGQSSAHRPAIDSNIHLPGDTGFFARFHGRVLVVDDNESNRDVLSRRLQRQGMEVAIAVDGRQALDRVHQEPFDLVLLDVLMPKLDGYSVLQQLKADPLTRDIPVIMISGLDEFNRIIQCIEAGAEDFLPKPCDPTLLRARISACLEKKTLRDAERHHLQTIQETQERLEEELTEAANYVRSIFPPPTESPLRIDWKYQPSTELGGDAFGYHWIDADHLAVYLLDVCGHGVGASLLSVTAINVIRSGSLPHTDFRDPGAVLSALNNAFPMEKQNNMYFTIWYGVYHAPSRTLRHASGGHPPALLLKPAGGGPIESERLRSPGLIVGAMSDLAYQSQACHVPPGAKLLVLCDGCYEIRGPDGEAMAFAEFEEFIRAYGSSPEGLDKLLQWVHDRHGDGPLDDDFSIVRIEF